MVRAPVACCESEVISDFKNNLSIHIINATFIMALSSTARLLLASSEIQDFLLSHPIPYQQLFPDFLRN